MALEQLDNSNISTHLGQSSSYSGQYDKSLLVREPRQSNRGHLGISEDEEPPFHGCDVWNGYEVSCLTNAGKPVAAIAKVIYPCNSKYIVESKSMKLYWNSFNMTQYGDNDVEAMDTMAKHAIEDLSELLETDVQVHLQFPDAVAETPVIANAENYVHVDIAHSEGLTFDTYSETPELLEFDEFEESELRLFKSNLLKSNCRVTSQPDWGDVFIGIKGTKVPTVDSLLKYIVSFRDECHFHEEICECIYKRLWDLCSPDELTVTCLYVRRGGWDINPHRVSHEYLYNNELADVGEMFTKQPRQ